MCCWRTSLASLNRGGDTRAGPLRFVGRLAMTSPQASAVTAEIPFTIFCAAVRESAEADVLRSITTSRPVWKTLLRPPLSVLVGFILARGVARFLDPELGL